MSETATPVAAATAAPATTPANPQATATPAATPVKEQPNTPAASAATPAAAEPTLATGKQVSPSGEGAKPEASPVPEKYELKLPDGSPLDAAHVEKIASFAKERGLSNDQAQLLLERESQAVGAHIEAQKTALKTNSEAWVKQAQSDKEIGGEAFKQNLEAAHRVIKRYATDSFRKALEDTGLGNHPELVRTFVRIGKAMTDDQLVIPGASGGTPKRSVEDVFYGGGSVRK